MAELFLMPKLGMDMEEGVIVKWLKAEGDAVKKGEALAEIETDKSTVEVESPAEGTILKLYYEEGTEKPCGTPIAAIGQPGEDIPAPPTAPAPADKDGKPAGNEKAEASAPAAPAQAVQAPAPAVPTPAAPVFPAPPAAPAFAFPAAPAAAALTPGGRIRSTPRARRLAELKGIPLAAVKGSGSEGRILEADVRRFAESGAAAFAAAPARRIAAETVQPASKIRKVTARRMFQSLASTAQTNHKVDVNMANLLAFREQINKKFEAQGVKISIMDLLTAVCAKALIENPQANAYWSPDGIRLHNYANVGIAVDTPNGLVVPVVKEADVMSLPEISAASKELIAKARDGRLQPDDMSGGTFTISNLGMLGIDSFTAILNPPETCILAVGRMAEKVVAEKGQIVIRPMMNLCLTYDHQIIDGADAARFLKTVRDLLENPAWLLL
ncbi:MAG: 2-oxo acid dehydrogenase subunit E2 [Lachnospiraceae bacterium]|nr:2-oxo acid dehydrogenase subunit E2 [Lachnospiraceae bacterium]